LVLLTQTLLFADGGILALGVNLLNMSLLAAGVGGLLFTALKKKFTPTVSAGLAATLLGFGVAVALGVEVAIGGANVTSAALLALVGTHFVLAIGEGLATLALVSVFAFVPESGALSRKALLVGTGVIALFLALSPLAYAAPDALEWTLEQFNMLHAASPVTFTAPLPDYQVSAALPEIISGLLAGIIGVAVVALAAAGIATATRKLAPTK
jgi:hypothetical protein